MPCMLDQDKNLENLIQMLQHLQSSKHPCPWRFSDILVEFCDVADKCTCPLSNLYIDTPNWVNIHLKEIRSLIDVGTIVINHIFYNNINQE